MAEFHEGQRGIRYTEDGTMVAWVITQIVNIVNLKAKEGEPKSTTFIYFVSFKPQDAQGLSEEMFKEWIK